MLDSASILLRKADRYVPRILKSRWTLLAICALALVLRMAVAVLFPGFEHADEVFQTLEQAHRLAFGNGFIPWEFDEGVRSYFFVGIVAGVFRVADRIAPGSYLLAARLVLSLFSLVAVWFSWAMLRRFASPRAAVIGAFLSAVWVELVYFGPKAHNEVMAAHMMLIGLYLVFPYFEDVRPSRLVLGGVLLGLSFCLRIQLALVMGILWLAMFWVNGWRRVLYCTVGALIGAAIAGAVDFMTLPYPFASIIGYYKINIIDEVSTKFGHAPWHFIILGFARVWSGALILFLWFLVEGVRKSRPMLLLVALAAGLILAHSAVAHKEYRYVYPALPLLLVPIAAGIDRVIARLYPSNSAALAVTLAGIAALSLVIASGANFRQHFYRRYGETKAFQIIRQSPDACGVALHLMLWGETPFYSVLHRNIPIYDGYLDADFLRYRDAANYVVSRVPEPGYTEIQEWDQGDDPVYLFRRDGGCTTNLIGERLLVDKRALWKNGSWKK
ncbi:MAG TPA: glycosyltransferase family 39 protein [Candidatus Solibacter sp.]|jgi:hypothetical protein